jgi:Protein of unknown function (DUF4232)
MTPTMFRTARLLPLTATAGIALLLGAAACDGRSTESTATGPIISTPGATTPATGPPTPTPTSTDRTTGDSAPVPPTKPIGPDRCHTADLTAALHNLDPAAGSRYARVVLTNRTSSTCRVYGYGGVQLLDAARHSLPTHQVRYRGTPPHLVLLQPGASVSSLLHWSPLPDGTENQTGPCQPTPTYLLVTPPDETQPITVPWSSSEACSHGLIVQTAYVAGTTPIH